MILGLIAFIYILLILNIVGDLWVLRGLPNWARPIYKTLRLLAWPLKRPFEGIFKTRMDLSSLAALLIFTYLIDPLLRTVFQ
jgi:hypothetical protein